MFIGLDVSLAKTAVCVVSEHGQIVKEAETESEPEALARWLDELEGSIAAIGLEAGPLSQWLHRGSDRSWPGCRSHGNPPGERSAEGDADQDGSARCRRDCTPSSCRLVPPGHCKSVSAQETRAVFDARKAIQQNTIALKTSLRGLLRNFGLKVGAISRGRFETRIRESADGNPMLVTATEPMLLARASLRQELAGL